MKPLTAGNELVELIRELFPICRSITGDGVRETLEILQQYLDIQVYEVPSGEAVLDWSVPKEWNIREAWVKDKNGEKLIDFSQHSLHVLNYSTPVKGSFTFEELKSHLFSLPDQPDLIPYRTSYYKENWGFCLSHHQLEKMDTAAEYDVLIDSSLEDGHLTYGEYVIPGTSKEEVLITTHICHPSLCNDNLSGISVCTGLAQFLSQKERRLTYRFLFIPGTIGAITWLARNRSKVDNIKYGIVCSLLGDDAPFTFKRSRRGNTETDQIAAHVLKHNKLPYQVIDFIPYGYDERQFCSPGFDLAVGNLSRSQWGQFPEYHTNADNFDLIKPECLEESLELLKSICLGFEYNGTYENLSPYGEPQLGRRGLYSLIGGHNDGKKFQMALLWTLNQSDGKHSLLDIAEKSGYSLFLIHEAAEALTAAELLKKIN